MHLSLELNDEDFMKTFAIECVGRSSVKSPLFPVQAENEEAALAGFAKEQAASTGIAESHFYDNFDAVEAIHQPSSGKRSGF